MQEKDKKGCILHRAIPFAINTRNNGLTIWINALRTIFGFGIILKKQEREWEMASVLGMIYLYFPEDKTEYIPAVITLAIFVLACVLSFMAIIKYSRKEEKRAEEISKRLEKEKYFQEKG